MPTVTVTTVQYRIDDVYEGDIPQDAIDGAKTETAEYGTVVDAVGCLRNLGLTEYSLYPVPVEPSPNGWWSNPDGAEKVYGGDQYDPGYDREEVTAVISGRGAYAVHQFMRDGSNPLASGLPSVLLEVREHMDNIPTTADLRYGLLSLTQLIATVRVFRPNGGPEWFRESNTLDGFDSIPELEVSGNQLSGNLCSRLLDGEISLSGLIRAGLILWRLINVRLKGEICNG